MNKATRIVFAKELRETLRDKRVLIGVMVFPLLVTPLLILASTFFAGKKAMGQKSAILPIGIYQEIEFPQLLEHLEADEKLKIVPLESPDHIEKAIEDRRIRAALIVSVSAANEFEQHATSPLEIVFNQANEKSENARQRLRKSLRSFDKAAVSLRLKSKALSENFIRPTKIKERSVASKESFAGYILGIFLPYIIIMSASFGGMTTAFDLCAGEKERGTMETLLVSPAPRLSIVQGKLYTVCVISVIAATCALIGIIVPLQSGLSIFHELIGDTFSISYPAIGGMLLIVLPLSLLTSSALLLVSSFARTPKEAQTYVFPFMMIVIFPAMLSSILGAESPLYTAFIPILNTALAMKQMLGGGFDSAYFIISLSTSIAYALVGARLATKLFQRESFIFRS